MDTHWESYEDRFDGEGDLFGAAYLEDDDDEFEDFEADFDADYGDGFDDFEGADLEAADYEEMLTEVAMLAENEDEVDEFWGAIASIGKKLLPKVARAISKIGKKAKRSGSRRAVKAVPAAAVRTARQVAKAARSGRPVSTRTVARIAARNLSRALKRPYYPKRRCCCCRPRYHRRPLSRRPRPHWAY